MAAGVGPVIVKSLIAATVNETLGVIMDARLLPYVSFIFESTDNNTISAGVITIEEAYYDPKLYPGGYRGTWSPITTFDCTTLTAGPKQSINHSFNAVAFQFLRARVSTAITGGGSVSVTFSGLGAG